MKAGFTLVELLIVIAIIGILATVSIRGYTETRLTADINIQTDTIISQLREAKSKSQNTLPNPTTGQIFCHGFLFQQNEPIQTITPPYINSFDKCDLPSLDLKLLYDNNLTVTQIEIVSNQQESSEGLIILYYPPKGDFQIFQIFQNAINNPNSPELALKDFDRINISTKLETRENKNHISILKSGVIMKSPITTTP